MPSPSYTYTLANSTTADADAVMQNFNDILNGVTDASKDISVAALTVAGTATFNGNVALGNATGDTITYTGRVASTVNPSASATYSVGSSGLAWTGVYLDNGATDGGGVYFDAGTTKYVRSNAAGTDLQIGGFTGLDLGTTCMIKRFSKYHEAKSADYTVTDSDGVSVILMTTGSASDRTVTLPTAADNSGRIIRVEKVDSGTKYCLVDAEGLETIDGGTIAFYLVEQYESVTVMCNGTAWFVTEKKVRTTGYSSNGINSGTDLTASTHTDIRSVTLQPGRYLVYGNLNFYPNSGVTGSGSIIIQITDTSGNNTTNSVENVSYVGLWQSYAADRMMSIWCPPQHITVTTASKIYYLKGYCSGFSGGVMDCSGHIGYTRIG